MNSKVVTPLTLKQINKEHVYQYIYQKKETSKMQIVQDLQLGLSTVSQNLTALEKEGYISRDGYFASTGGRKAQVIRIVPDRKISIGIGILKDRFHLVAVDLYGTMISMDTILLPYVDTEEYYDQFAEEVLRLIQLHSYPDEKISGVAIAVQGIIAPDGTSVTYGAIMNNLNMKLSDFSSRLPYPCHLVHDSKAAADLELWNHPTLDSAVVFLLNPNLGGALITNHCVHQGFSMRSGILEHICIDPKGPSCYCGHQGCLETYCSANALEQTSGVSVETFFHTLRTEHSSAFCKIWEEYLQHLAFAIRNLNLLIDSPIILSGYLAPYFTPEDLEFLLTKINESTPFPLQKEQILVGSQGQYTPAAGAALFYVKQYLTL